MKNLGIILAGILLLQSQYLFSKQIEKISAQLEKEIVEFVEQNKEYQCVPDKKVIEVQGNNFRFFVNCGGQESLKIGSIKHQF